MGNGRFNCVAILDAIPSGELNTARITYDAIRDIAAYEIPGLQVRYFRVETTAVLESVILSLKGEVTTSGLLPWVHLEGHGTEDESGFLTAGHDLCSWEHLKSLLIPLNIATDLNLLLVLATCYGGSFTRAITTVDRAPVLGLIGPTREVTAGEIEIDFASFYKTFFSTHSIREALVALTRRAAPGLYYSTNAEAFFYKVWAGYKKNECSPTRIAKRARVIYRQLKGSKLERTPSVGHLKRQLASQECTFFERYCETYFMYDLNPANRKRFQVSYKQAEANRAC